MRGYEGKWLCVIFIKINFCFYFNKSKGFGNSDKFLKYDRKLGWEYKNLNVKIYVFDIKKCIGVCVDF